MLESEAKEKFCPFMLSADAPLRCLCVGSACMGWEQLTDLVYEEGSYTKVKARRPKDPPQGYCAMIPPELNCNYE